MATKQATIQSLEKPEVGKIYETKRDNENLYQVLYLDEQIVLLRCTESGRKGGNVHRIERRVDFDSQIESGWFNHVPNSTLDMTSFNEIDWSEVDHIGEKTKDNLHEAGFKTNLDIQQAKDDELLEVGGLGNAGLTNLRNFSQ
jgi:hypothetical protein